MSIYMTNINSMSEQSTRIILHTTLILSLTIQCYDCQNEKVNNTFVYLYLRGEEKVQRGLESQLQDAFKFSGISIGSTVRIKSKKDRKPEALKRILESFTSENRNTLICQICWCSLFLNVSTCCTWEKITHEWTVCSKQRKYKKDNSIVGIITSRLWVCTQVAVTEL